MSFARMGVYGEEYCIESVEGDMKDCERKRPGHPSALATVLSLPYVDLDLIVILGPLFLFKFLPLPSSDFQSLSLPVVCSFC